MSFTKLHTHCFNLSMLVDIGLWVLATITDRQSYADGDVYSGSVMGAMPASYQPYALKTKDLFMLKIMYLLSYWLTLKMKVTKDQIH